MRRDELLVGKHTEMPSIEALARKRWPRWRPDGGGVVNNTAWDCGIGKGTKHGERGERMQPVRRKGGAGGPFLCLFLGKAGTEPGRQARHGKLQV